MHHWHTLLPPSKKGLKGRPMNQSHARAKKPRVHRVQYTKDKRGGQDWDTRAPHKHKDKQSLVTKFIS